MKKAILTSVIAMLLGSCLLNKYEKRIRGSYTLDKGEYLFLNDSSIIEGTLYDVYLKEDLNHGNVRIKNSKIGAIVDSSGKFSLKIPPGEYIFIASSIGCTDLPTNVITLKKNEKKSISFRLGTYLMREK